MQQENKMIRVENGTVKFLTLQSIFSDWAIQEEIEQSSLAKYFSCQNTCRQFALLYCSLSKQERMNREILYEICTEVYSFYHHQKYSLN